MAVHCRKDTSLPRRQFVVAMGDLNIGNSHYSLSLGKSNCGMGYTRNK